jgi:hypothetical protein
MKEEAWKEYIYKLVFLTLICLAGFAAAGVRAQSIESSENSARRRCQSDFASPEDYLEFAACHRRNSALISYSVAPNGEPARDDPTIFHNEDEPMALASVVKIIHLAAYARALSEGLLKPNQRIEMGDWQRNYLPGSDGNAHVNALDEIGVRHDPYGFAVNQKQEVRLEQMIRAMMKFSDNAAPDWLLERLGEDYFRQTINLLGMKRQQMPLYLTGFHLLDGNHEQGNLNERALRQLLRLSPARFAREARRLHDAFQEPSWKQAEFGWRLAGNPVENRKLMGALFAAQYTKGTAREYAALMARLATNNVVISPQVTRTMRRHLEWGMEDAGIRNLFTAYGSKGGSWAGGNILDASYYVPRGGDFEGQPRVVVQFVRSLTPDAFDRLSQVPLIQIFGVKLALERNFALEVERKLDRRGFPQDSENGDSDKEGENQ